LKDAHPRQDLAYRWCGKGGRKKLRGKHCDFWEGNQKDQRKKNRKEKASKRGTREFRKGGKCNDQGRGWPNHREFGRKSEYFSKKKEREGGYKRNGPQEPRKQLYPWRLEEEKKEG